MESCYNSPRAKDVIHLVESRPVAAGRFSFYLLLLDVQKTGRFEIIVETDRGIEFQFDRFRSGSSGKKLRLCQ